MKNFIYGFISAIILIICVAAAPQGRTIMLLEPVTPEKTVIIYDKAGYSESLKLPQKAEPYLKQGYIIKSVSLCGANGYGETGIIVLEKF